MPKSVQQSIPIQAICADGIWRSGEVYSQMRRLSDINGICSLCCGAIKL